MSFVIPGWTGTKEQLQMQKEIDESFQKKKTEEKFKEIIEISKKDGLKEIKNYF